jgi:hypothetical protein
MVRKQLSRMRHRRQYGRHLGLLLGTAVLPQYRTCRPAFANGGRNAGPATTYGAAKRPIPICKADTRRKKLTASKVHQTFTSSTYYTRFGSQFWFRLQAKVKEIKLICFKPRREGGGEYVQLHALAALTPARVAGTHSVAGWVNYRLGLHSSKNRANVLPLSGFERSLGRPAHNLITTSADLSWRTQSPLERASSVTGTGQFERSPSEKCRPLLKTGTVRASEM